jgi:ATP-dependent RNA helicase DeaD
MQSTLFGELGLSPELLQAVQRMGFESASPIQAATIPALLEGHDVAGLSRTGSGKTAAFAIPAVQKVDPAIRAPQVLILCPTRELAVQIAGEVAKLSAFSPGIRELAIYGGQSYGPQYRGLEEGAQIIAGTPGRIIDHLERGSLQLDQIRMVVLDEADRMLDMGFRDDIANILKQAPENRQTAFFSATMPPQVEQLIHRNTRQPRWVRLETRAEAAPDIDQSFYEVTHGSRVGALCRVLEATNLRFGIIFCSTKSAVDGVTEHLIAEGYQADRLHGDMSQAMRERVMRRFRDGQLEFLVATDVAARGIDVDDVEAVINYDIPRDPEDYVHRIGRTGRAGRSGKAMTFITKREFHALDRIQRLTRVKIRRERMPTPAEAARCKAESLLQNALQISQAGRPQPHADLVAQFLAQTAPELAVHSLLTLLTHGKAALRNATAAARTPAPHPDASNPSPENSPSPQNSDSRAEFAEEARPHRSPRYPSSRPPRPYPSNQTESRHSPSRPPAHRKAYRTSRPPGNPFTDSPSEGRDFRESSDFRDRPPHSRPAKRKFQSGDSESPRYPARKPSEFPKGARVHPKTGAPRLPRKPKNPPL